jgi:hypothetical protein
MLGVLEGAEFGGTPIETWKAEELIEQVERLLESVD